MGDKDKKETLEEKRNTIIAQMDKAIQKRDEYHALVFKCQGALEVIDSMEDKEND
tara:strand:- start:1157 stop:1321 length:165 start_codon:yes stop_codon:yes gene_type:complete